MDDQSATQQAAGTQTQTFLAQAAGSLSGAAGEARTEPDTKADAASDDGAGAGTAIAGEVDPKANEAAQADPAALQAEIDELRRRNEELSDHIADREAQDREAEAEAAHVRAQMQANDEAEAARAAGEELQARIRVAGEAGHAYRMAGFVAIEAAVSVSSGIYSPDRLAAAVGHISEWSDRATDAVLALGEIAHRPGAVPPRDVLDAQIVGHRADAKARLGALVMAAASFADLLEVAPHNTPALLAIERTMSEQYLAAYMAVLGLGQTLAARGQV